MSTDTAQRPEAKGGLAGSEKSPSVLPRATGKPGVLSLAWKEII